MRRRVVLLLCATLLALLMPGCTVVKKENRYASRLIETTMWPEGVAGRIAVAPVVGPLWVVGLVVDAVVVNPVLSLPRALGTACRAYALIPPLPIVNFAVFPVRVVMFPAAFIGSELVYSFFPM
jgi:hypothetical protein